MDREYFEGWWRAVYGLLYRPDPEAIRVVVAALHKLEGREGKMVMPAVSGEPPVRIANHEMVCPICGGNVQYVELGYGQRWAPSHEYHNDKHKGPIVWMTAGELDYDCDGPQAFVCDEGDYVYVPVWDTEPDGGMEWD